MLEEWKTFLERRLKNTAERLRDDDLIAVHRDILGKYQKQNYFI